MNDHDTIDSAPGIGHASASSSPALLCLRLCAALALVAVVPACRGVPNSLTFLSGGDDASAEQASDLKEVNRVVPQMASHRRSAQQIVGAEEGSPVVGETLPYLPREQSAAYCAPPLPYYVSGPWAPPGLKLPYPADEYLHDGGDAMEPVSVSPEWRVDGLNMEDTVAHYDTLDGRTLVEPSNCAYVYAPRFSSVRTIDNLVSNNLLDGPAAYNLPEEIVRLNERARATTRIENAQPLGRTGNLKLGVFHVDQRNDVKSIGLLPYKIQDEVLPFENLSVILTGVMLGSEKALLSQSVENAVTWTKDDGVKIVSDKQAAAIESGDQRAQAIYVVKGGTNARLRICKVASTPAAQPGDFVDFTLRYDNVGDQPLGNIVILDSLTTRLAYEPDSAKSSRRATFSTQVNEGESLELRWEIDEPLLPGDGGIVRFRCKVR